MIRHERLYPCHCQRCERRFKASRQDAQYCTDACRQASYRDRQREKLKASLKVVPAAATPKIELSQFPAAERLEVLENITRPDSLPDLKSAHPFADLKPRVVLPRPAELTRPTKPTRAYDSVAVLSVAIGQYSPEVLDGMVDAPPDKRFFGMRVGEHKMTIAEAKQCWHELQRSERARK